MSGNYQGILLFVGEFFCSQMPFVFGASRMTFLYDFYCAMHYSANQGIGISCRLSVRLSVRPSVCDFGGSGPHRWKSWKIIARSISPTPLLFVAHRRTWENLGSVEVGWEKVACWSTKATISLKHVKVEEKLPWRAYRNSPMLFQTIPPTASSSPRLGFVTPAKKPKLQSLLSQELVKLCTSNLARTFTGSIQTKVH